MSKTIRIIIAITIIALAIFIFYLIWQGFSFLATLIPWYLSLISFSIGCIMYFVGRHFVKKKNVFVKKENKIILSTPIQADLLIIIGSIIMIISVFTSKLFFSGASEDFMMMSFSVILLIFGVGYLVYKFFQLKHSLNDGIEIGEDEFRFDEALSNESKIYKKDNLLEIVLLKEYKDTRSNKEKLINLGQPMYNSDEYNLSLAVKQRSVGNEKEESVVNLDPKDLNIDLSIFVEALQSMNYSIAKRSKYDCSEQLWEGHDFEEGFYFKD